MHLKKKIRCVLIFKRKSEKENKCLDCSDLCKNSESIKGDKWEGEKRFPNTKMSIKQEICFDKDLRRKYTCEINMS